MRSNGCIHCPSRATRLFHSSPQPVRLGGGGPPGVAAPLIGIAPWVPVKLGSQFPLQFHV